MQIPERPTVHKLAVNQLITHTQFVMETRSDTHAHTTLQHLSHTQSLHILKTPHLLVLISVL